eukprot:NODE_617_length_5938_cov_0.189416.p3 type:complete len:158 gc:universal NODE_617_length_5938_cov_0.189416:2700-2227(-)
MSEIINSSEYFWSTTASKSPLNQQEDSIAILKLQKSVIRTNCMDCLDRTNLLQAQIALRVLSNQLLKLGIQTEDYPHVHALFKNVWADNGNQISQCYAGTNAMKNDFTRNGQRDITGFAQDASSSVQRLYLNYVRDGYTQKLLDVLQGLEDSEVLFK